MNSLKRACKKLGVPCTTGKKEVLKNRVRDTILNSSTAVFQPDETQPPQGDLDPFDDIPLDPEFQPVPSDGKRLFDRDDAPSGPPTSSRPPKTPKRKRIADGEENNGAGEEAPASSKKCCRHPLAFMTSSPRTISAAENGRTSIHHQKQTAASSNKRLVPDARQSTAVTKRQTTTPSVKKQLKRGMNAAVMMALKSNDAHLNDSM